MEPVSFVSGILFAGGIALIVDLFRNKKSLKNARLEIEALKKKAKSVKEKKTK